MPSMIGSIVQGFKKYGSLAKYQTTHNTVAQTYDKAKQEGTSPAKGVAKAVGAGMATFLAPPVVIGHQAVKDYRQKKVAEQQQSQKAILISSLKSHGISPKGAQEIATVIIDGASGDYFISESDFKMWMVVASVIEPQLAEYTPRIADRRESTKPKTSLA